jgi:hypothetical protein
VTNEPARVAPDVLRVVRHVLSTSIEAVTVTLPLVPRDRVAVNELAAGEALDVPLDDRGAGPVRRFRVGRRETDHRRHVKKYATGRLPPERSFHFRGPSGALDLVAHNLETFTMLARGVDEETWLHHLQNGDVAGWLREHIRDPELADEVERMAHDRDATRSRRAVLAAIARRYTPVVGPGGDEPAPRGV